MQISACVAPANAPCQPFYVNTVALANLKLQQISGAGQISTGAAFQSIVARVTDSSSPPNSVAGATVVFLTTVLRPEGSSPGGGDGENNPGDPASPVILSVSQSSVISNTSGLVSIVPSSGGFSAPVEVNVAASTGTAATLTDLLEVLPTPVIEDSSGGTLVPPIDRRPVRAPLAVETGSDNLR